MLTFLDSEGKELLQTSSKVQKWYEWILPYNHHKNGIFSFKYRIPHSCDSSFLVNSFLSSIGSSSSYYNIYYFIYPMYLLFSIHKSLKESSFGITVPPSQLPYTAGIYLNTKSVDCSALSPPKSGFSNKLDTLLTIYSLSWGRCPPPPTTKMLVRNFFLIYTSLIDIKDAVISSSRGS